MDMNWTSRTNMSMLTDFYELTMGKGYLDQDLVDRIAYFDLFFRQVPEQGGYAIMAGVEQIVDYLKNLHFTEEDIAFLRSTRSFDERFLIFPSRAMSGRFRKEPRFSQVSRL